MENLQYFLIILKEALMGPMRFMNLTLFSAKNLILSGHLMLKMNYFKERQLSLICGTGF